MNSRERTLMALSHQEPDRVPFDVGGTAQSQVSLTAYAKLRKYLDLPEAEIGVQSLSGQMAGLDEDFLERLRVDTRLVNRGVPSDHTVTIETQGDYRAYQDEWGIGWRMPKAGGLYYDMYAHPLDVDDVQYRLKTYAWPDPVDPSLFEGMRARARTVRDEGRLVVLNGLCAGILEIYSWLRGYTRFYIDLATEPKMAGLLLDKVLELKMAYWERALSEAGEFVDVVNEADDVAGQHGLLMSPETYRRLIKPRHRALFAGIKRQAPHVKVFMHSCGAIRPLIPDFIEIGVDILNPVQISARGMDPQELKRDFGQDVVFWGGGVDTQQVFGSSSSQEVRDDVRRNIEALAPGGGFVFATVHNTQANVPPENFMAMWETVQEYGTYGRK